MPVENAGDIGFLHVFETLDLVSRVGFHSDDQNVRIAFFHGPENTHGCARCSESDDDRVDSAFCLLNDFRTCSKMMRGGIGRIVELVRHEVTIRVLPDHLIDLLDGTVGA